MKNEAVYNMSFSKVYPLLENKALKKGRTLEEVCEVVTWLTGYTKEDIERFKISDISYGDFFLHAPCLHPNRHMITGSIWGVKIETIEEPLLKEIRYLDKLIDELAKGKAITKVCRGNEK